MSSVAMTERVKIQDRQKETKKGAQQPCTPSGYCIYS